MVLLLEAKNYPPKGYVNIKFAKKLLANALNVDLSGVLPYVIHKILQSSGVTSCKVKLDTTIDRTTVFYRRKELESMVRQDSDYDIDMLIGIANKLYKETGIKSNILKPYANKVATITRQTQKIEPQETPWDETNMDYVRWQLDQRINDSKIHLSHLITERILKKLKF